MDDPSRERTSRRPLPRRRSKADRNEAEGHECGERRVRDRSALRGTAAGDGARRDRGGDLDALVRSVQIEQLRAFVAVAAEGQFSRAADRLGCSTSTVSRSVKALERALGVKLVERDPDRVRLTAQGAAALPYAATCLERFAALRRTPPTPASAQTAAPAVTCLIASELPPRVAHICHTLIPGLFAGEAEVDVRASPQSVATRSLSEGSSELAVFLEASESTNGAAAPRTTQTAQEVVPLLAMRWCVAMRSDDRLSSEPTLSLEHLRGRTIVIPTPDLPPPLHSAFASTLHSGGATVVPGVGGAQSISALVQHGGALALVLSPAYGGAGLLFQDAPFCLRNVVGIPRLLVAAGRAARHRPLQSEGLTALFEALQALERGAMTQERTSHAESRVAGAGWGGGDSNVDKGPVPREVPLRPAVTASPFEGTHGECYAAR